MKNIKQETKKEIMEDSDYIYDLPMIIKPKQGLSGKKHCICYDCDIFGCDENCKVCYEIFEQSF